MKKEESLNVQLTWTVVSPPPLIHNNKQFQWKEMLSKLVLKGKLWQRKVHCQITSFDMHEIRFHQFLIRIIKTFVRLSVIFLPRLVPAVFCSPAFSPAVADREPGTGYVWKYTCRMKNWNSRGKVLFETRPWSIEVRHMFGSDMFLSSAETTLNYVWQSLISLKKRRSWSEVVSFLDVWKLLFKSAFVMFVVFVEDVVLFQIWTPWYVTWNRHTF